MSWIIAGGLSIAALAIIGALMPVTTTRGMILASLLFVPDLPSGHSLGLLVAWSSGLTLTNYVVPALALPLLLGAWLAGRPLAPARWPPLAGWMLALLGWSAIALLPWALAGALNAPQSATLALHWLKLVLFLCLGVVLAGGGEASGDRWRRRRNQLLVTAIAVNGLIGLAQMAGWLTSASPLAQGSGSVAARATGLFYDANMYGVLAAWALLWLLTAPCAGSGARQWARGIMVALVAVNVAGAQSRAGFAALGLGLLVLAWRGQRRPALWALGLAALALILFPVRVGQRVLAAAATAEQAWHPSTIAPAQSLDASSQSRLETMTESLRQVAQHPWLGGGFGRALYLGVPAAGAGVAGGPATAEFRGAQNMPLTVLAASGPVGLALLLLAMAAPLRRRQARPAFAGAAPRRLPLVGSPGPSQDRPRGQEVWVMAGYCGFLLACLTNEAMWNARLLALVVLLTATGFAAPRGLGEDACATAP